MPMNTKMAGLPPGFQFFPSDEDLVVHFLYPKALSLFPGQDGVIPSLDLYDPWELDGRALQGGNHWYFFTRRTGKRVTAGGYWEAETDDDDIVRSGNKEVGIKRTLVFYVGEAPEGIKTSWLMHEYHLLESVGSGSSSSSSSRNSKRSSKKKRQRETVTTVLSVELKESEGWVICQVFDASCNSQERLYDDGTELSCLDEAFLTCLDDDLDEISWPN